MVKFATRGELPRRFGPGVQQFPDGTTGSTLDRRVYTDPVRFELERERVLRSSWLLAGRSSAIADVGDWMTFEGHGETVVVTRQPSGGVAAFHNVCPHRGPSFVTELTGTGARRFQCPYHGWVMDTTGSVVGVSEREFFEPEHIEHARSPVVAAAEWGGWVWINLAGADAGSLLDWLGEELSADLGAYRMEDMVLLERLEWDVPVNYKAIVDGFNEVYHATVLHHTPPEFTKAARETTFFTVGHNSMMFVPRPEHMDALSDEGDHHRHAICHYVVFPNTTFNCNPKHIQVFNPIPVDVDRTKFYCWQLIYDGDRNDPEYAAYYDSMMVHWEVLKGVVAEDIGIYEQLKRTKRSMGYTQNILSRHECKITRYHQIMDERIRNAD
jgi:phenylpropionate dioxygenase-like ring-hydroxylating dioxygenase large terminal subunit